MKAHTGHTCADGLTAALCRSGTKVAASCFKLERRELQSFGDLRPDIRGGGDIVLSPENWQMLPPGRLDRSPRHAESGSRYLMHTGSSNLSRGRSRYFYVTFAFL
jgi:hypothetical protein